jgi:hypothetical protein
MRLRVLLVGIAAVIALGIVIPMCDFLHIGTHIAHTFMPIGPVFLFFFFALILNSLLRIFKIELAGRELLLIYAMMTIACGFGPGCFQYLIPAITAPFYYAAPENNYEILHRLIPDWMAPRNPDTIKYLYEGSPGWASVPWTEWIVPMFWWSLLILAVALVGFCLAIIMRKQWVENERLVFPLVYVPVEIVKDEPGDRVFIPPFFRNRLMWLAFSIPVVIYTLRGLHFYFPAVPDSGRMLMVWLRFTGKPWNSLTMIFLQTVFTTIGLTYFVPTSVSFSVWFFFLFFQFQVLIGAILGFRMPFSPGEAFNRAFIDYQVAGGIIAFAALSLWSMRPALRDRRAKSGETRRRGESPRRPFPASLLPLLGLIGGFLFICFWGMAAGARLWSVVLYFLIFFSIVTVVSRLVAEAGLFYVGYKIFPFEIMLPFTGTARLGGAGLMAFVLFNQGIQREFRVDTMAFFLNNIKMDETAKIGKRWLFASMWLAILIGLPAAGFSVLRLMYRYGGVNIGRWWTVSVARDIACKNATRYITSPISPDPKNILTIIIGGGVTIFLFMMRRLFLWWPFHPIGYVMAGSYSIYHLWWPTFIGWLAKVFVLKYGGLRIYQKLKPFFMGLVLGECIVVGGWVVIDLILGTKGNFLFWL